MKSKVWSIISIIVAIICFILSLVCFFYAAIGGKVSMANVSGTNYLLSIIGLVTGIISLFCASKRTEWKVSLVASISNLSKIGMMLCIIVLAATLMNA